MLFLVLAGLARWPRATELASVADNKQAVYTTLTRPPLAMRTVRRHLQALARLALLAMVSLSLLPTLAHALAQASGGQAMTEVCTPQGMKLVVLADEAPVSPADTAQKSLGHLDHCPYCCPGLQGFAPPPQGVALPPTPLLDVVPALFLDAPHTLFVWRTSQPRGPPLQS